jgi:hypothetical protein
MKDDKNPLEIVAWGLAIGLGLTGLGLLLKWVLPALGAVVGIATSIISGGLIASSFNSWVVPAASAGLLIGGGSTLLLVFVRVAKEAKKNTFEWALPILAIFAGLVIDLCKELYTEKPIARVIYATSVSALYLLGGILWRLKREGTKQIFLKITSIIIFLLPPFLIYFKYAMRTGKGIFNAYKGIPFETIWSIIILLLLLALIAIISWVLKEDDL